MEIAVIGGGAAGFFAAITCVQANPDERVTIYEKTNKLLAKVKISGGGRCNVTHASYSNGEFAKHYPRGGKMLKKSFSQFNSSDTINWFESRGVKLKTEKDNRMFPITDDSQTIIDCLLRETSKLGVSIKLKAPVSAIKKVNNQFSLTIDTESVFVDRVIIASGGSPKEMAYQWLNDLGHKVNSPVPSLFTFNIPNNPIKKLMGVSVPNVQVKIQGEKLKTSGPLLITHWGMSGPAVLKLSAWGARLLNDKGYDFSIQVNWLGDINENELRENLVKERAVLSARNIGNRNPFGLPQRLWDFLLNKIDIAIDSKWRDLHKKDINRIINLLLNDVYLVKGKTTFKEEFVTCGGVVLDSINTQTMESKVCKGMFFAGEVLDIDGVTGGFNFQAAWTTGYIAGKSACY